MKKFLLKLERALLKMGVVAQTPWYDRSDIQRGILAGRKEEEKRT